MSTLTITKSSDTNFIGNFSFTKTSDSFFSFPSISKTSDTYFIAPIPPPPPIPPFVLTDTRLCGVRITCAGTDSPIINVSAETDDGPNFRAQRWPSIDPSQLPNPILQTFTAGNCYGVVTSNISQADADAQAERNAFLCQHTDPVTGHVFGGVSANSPQSFTVNCPDGSPFTYTVPAGTFFAINQFQANQQAMGYAKQQANSRLICIGSLPTGYAVGTQVTQTVTATGNLSPFPYSDLWELEGALPGGLDFNGGFINAQEAAAGVESPPSITGTPTAGGTFVFSIRITNWIGDFQIKQFIFNVSSTSYKVTPVITSGAISFFNNGASFAAGNYTISYVNGAFIAVPNGGYQVWNYMINFSGGNVGFLPASRGTYPNQAQAEAVNGGATLQITHSGGPIGMFLSDGFYGDNVAGIPNPTFQIVSS